MSQFTLSELSAVMILVGAATFFVGGTVKGILGLGLPMVSVPVLALAMDPPVAIALMFVPMFTTNVWQALRGSHLKPNLVRFWPLLLAMAAVTSVSARFMVELEPRRAALVLGVCVMIFCASQIFPIKARVPARAERWLGPLVGIVSGVIGGVSNLFGPTLVAYLVALRLDRDTFVAAIALFFIVAGIPLYINLAVGGVLTLDAVAASAAAMLVIVPGMAAGTRLRSRIPQKVFHRILVTVLFVIALNLIRRGLV